MTVRKVVLELASLGPLPSSDVAIPEAIDEWYDRLKAIAHPVNQEEALILLTLFGPDDCYGLAWSLLHLIETCPSGVPIRVKPDESANEWVRFLWDRSHREWM